MWLGGGLDLLDESLGAKGGGQLGPEDLAATLRRCFRSWAEVDHRQPAASELTCSGVAINEGSSRPVERADHQNILVLT